MSHEVIENAEDYDPQRAASQPLAGDAAQAHIDAVRAAGLFGDAVPIPAEITPTGETVEAPVEEPVENDHGDPDAHDDPADDPSYPVSEPVAEAPIEPVAEPVVEAPAEEPKAARRGRKTAE